MYLVQVWDDERIKGKVDSVEATRAVRRALSSFNLQGLSSKLITPERTDLFVFNYVRRIMEEGDQFPRRHRLPSARASFSWARHTRSSVTKFPAARLFLRYCAVPFQTSKIGVRNAEEQTQPSTGLLGDAKKIFVLSWCA